ncbi:MAG: ribonuclease H-like domain-containing protein [Nitrospiraceae bacterium]|nr:ribonuclease H-like domain-containing protein [Nitrospiraceae bacterium]
MSRIIFDIETAGRDFDSLEPQMQEYFLRFAETDEDVAAVRDSLSFYPLTGEIVAIGMLNPDSGKGAVYFQAPLEEPMLPFEEDGMRYESGTEKEIIEKFWQTIKSYDQFITFNGRCFDCPYILVRGALHKVRPTRELMPNRYGVAHIDLLDQLTFFGATRRRFSLDMWCRFLGIRSPKEETTGHEVKELFKAGKYLEIARYCAGDIRATKEVLDYWDKYMRFSPQERKNNAC